MNTLEALKAAGERANMIERALDRLKHVEQKLALTNKYAAENKDKSWKVELALDKSERYNYNRAPTVDVHIPYDYVVRQVINEVIEARRAVVRAGGEVPTASEQVQRAGR